MSIHYARYEKSERLQRALAFILDGRQHTTLEIIHGADVCAVNSAMDELRANGFDARCVKKTRPAVYQLHNIESARQLSAALLAK